MPYVRRESFENIGGRIRRVFRRIIRRTSEIEEQQSDIALALGGYVSPETLERWRTWQSEREGLIWRGTNPVRAGREVFHRAIQDNVRTIQDNIRTIQDNRQARFEQIGGHPILERRPYRLWDENILNTDLLPDFRLNPTTHHVEAVPRTREVSLADLEAELNDEISVGCGVMPPTYTNYTDNSTGIWHNEYTVGEVVFQEEELVHRCSGCQKKITNTSKARKLKWGVYICENCDKEYTYLIKILREMRGNWNTIHYIYDYAMFLIKKKYVRVKSRDKQHGCFVCGHLKKNIITYKIAGRHRHVYICNCCDPYAQYMMKSIHSQTLQIKMKRLVNMLKNQDEDKKIKAEFLKAKV